MKTDEHFKSKYYTLFELRRVNTLNQNIIYKKYYTLFELRRHTPNQNIIRYLN